MVIWPWIDIVVVVVCQSSYGSISWYDRRWGRYHPLVCSIYLCSVIWYCSSALIPHTSALGAKMTLEDHLWSHNLLPGNDAFPRCPETYTRGSWSRTGFREVCTTPYEQNLPLVSALVSEVLRWGGILPLGALRRAQQQDIYVIPKNMTVLPNIWYRCTDLIALYLLIRDAGGYVTTKLLTLTQWCSTAHVSWVWSLNRIQVRLSLDLDEGELWSLLQIQVFTAH